MNRQFEPDASANLLRLLQDPNRRTLASTGDDDERLEERRRRRRAGDPRLSPEARELLRRLTTADLGEEFQAALDAVSDADPLLGGGPDADDERVTVYGGEDRARRGLALGL